MLKRPKWGLIRNDGFLVYHYDEVTSTNDLLMQAGREGALSGTTVTAKCQTAGKGSKGRSFYSPPTGLYLSTLIRPGARISACKRDNGLEIPICPLLTDDEIPLITPAVACAVADSAERLTRYEMGIKWVNDIYFTGRKVAGILTESGVDEAGDRFYVIGVGVNIFPPEGGFPEEFAETTTSLFRSREAPRASLSNLLDDWILENINKRLNQIKGRDFLYDYSRRSVILGYTVEVHPLNGDPPYLAEAVKIDHNARLVVRPASGELITLNSEEVKMSLKETVSGKRAEVFDLAGRINTDNE